MLEKGIGFKNVLTDFKRDMNSANLGTGITAAVFGLSAGVIHISAGTAAGLPSDFLIFWVTSMCFINGFFGLLVPSYYRQPIPMANSIPGALLFAAVIPTVGIGPTLGATLIAGILTAAIGLSGAMGKIMRFTPMPIVLGMIGGVLLRFGLNLVAPLQTAFIPSLLMIVAYLVTMKYVKNFPAVLSALVVGIVWLLTSGLDFSKVSLIVDLPRPAALEFTLEAFLAYGLPLTIILVGMETPVGVGILKAVGYKKIPANGVTFANGLGTIVGSFFNLHSTAIAAPMTAIVASPDSGKHEKRWVAAVIVGIIWIAAAPFYGTLVTLFQIMPRYFINIIAGLALIKVLISTIGGSLGAENHKIGALFAFLIAASGIKLLGVGASFWALIIGIMISLFIETEDFQFRSRRKEAAVVSSGI